MPAAAIVAVVLLGLTSLRHARQSGATPRYATASGTPGPPQRDLARTHAGRNMYGDAPWALSALPECFRQVASASGVLAFVRAKMPVDVRLVADGATLVSADCTLLVGKSEIRVKRGTDRLRVPPVTHLYEASGGRLVLERSSGRRAELRVYLRAGAF